jgi:hypothetical protein
MGPNSAATRRGSAYSSPASGFPGVFCGPDGPTAFRRLRFARNASASRFSRRWASVVCFVGFSGGFRDILSDPMRPLPIRKRFRYANASASAEVLP